MTRARTNADNWAADITGVTAGTGITGGGTSGTVTVTNSLLTTIDAKGDLLVGSAADTAVRVPVGTNDHVLTADSSTTSGVKWSALPSSGYTWTRRLNHTTTDAINTIAYNGTNLYVAAGAAGVLFTSPDGITWTSRTSGFGANAINRVAFGNGLWVAVGNSGTITTSTDGITWTARTSNMSTNAINDVIYKNSLWVAVGAGGGTTNTGGIISSTDGLTWTRKSQSLTVGANYWSVDYNGTNWVVGADNSTNNALYASTPQGTWTTVALVSSSIPVLWLKCDGVNTYYTQGSDFKFTTSATLASPLDIINTSSVEMGTRDGIRRTFLYNGQIYKALRYISNFSTTITNQKTLNSTMQLLPTATENSNNPFVSSLFGCVFVGAAGVIIGSNSGEIYTSF